MTNKIKTYVIAIGSILLTILTVGAYARYQKRKADKLIKDNKQLQQANKDFQETIGNYEERNQQETNANRLDDDAINQQLLDNGNLHD